MNITDYATIVVHLNSTPQTWRATAWALWYARGTGAPIRRFARRPLGARHPAWQWTGGSGLRIR